MADEPNLDPDPAVDPPTDPPVDPDPDPEPFDQERAMKTIRALREKEREGKRVAKELAEIQGKLKEFEDAQKSELDKAKDAEKEARDKAKLATERVRNANLKAALYDKAQELGVVSPSLALKALDRKKIEWDDSDEPANLEPVLEALLDEEPALKATPRKKTPSTDAGGGVGGGEPPKLTAEQLQAAKDLGYTDPAEYIADMNLKTISDWTARREKQPA